MEKFVLILGLLGLAFGSDVLDLSEGFGGEIGRHDLMLVEFFAPWCGHCKKLAPEYEKAATALLKEDPSVPLAKVDCTADGGKETCGQYGVSGYPTLKVFRNGELASDYEGPRSANGIITEMKKLSGPMAKEVENADQIKAAIEGSKTVVAGFFSKDGKDKENFIKAASNLFTNYKVFYSLSEEINTEFGYSDAVVLFRPKKLKNKFEDAKLQMTGSITRANIEKFVKKNGMGLCGHMTADNKDLFEKPLVVTYYDIDYERNAKVTNYWRNRVMKVGKTYADKDVTFAIAATGDFIQDLESVGLAPLDNYPVVAAWSANGDKFKMEETFTSDGKALDAFVGKFLAGELAAYLKSEPIPDSDDGPVKTVVASNFNEIVMDDTKDVLIEFYAPWCGHCKQLEPKFTELGEKMQDAEHIVIAKMDGTANDVPLPFQVSGFPTIYWVPAGKKSSPQKYPGGREVDDFVNFITKESTKPVKLGLKKLTKPDEL